MTWPEATESGRSVSLVRWCRSRPSVFFVFDADSYLYIWDLNMDASSALKRQQVSTQARLVLSRAAAEYFFRGNFGLVAEIFG